MPEKKTLGIVGGMGSQASTWMLKRITELSNGVSDQDYLEVILHSNSRIPDRTQAILYGGKNPVPYLRESLTKLGEFGADVAILACMTAYYYFEQIKDSFSGELLHPVDFVVAELTTNPAFQGRRKLGLIGSTGMIKAGVFHNRIDSAIYDIIVLDDIQQQEYFMDPIYKRGGFKSGLFTQENLKVFREQAALLKEAGAEVVIGACSEVPLVMDQDHLDLPFIDAFEVFARKVVGHCYSKKIQKNVI